MKPEESQDGTPFNMAMMYYMELHNLRQLKSKAVIENNLFAYYDILEEIYISIQFKFLDKERNEIEKLLKEAFKDLRSNGSGSIGQQIQFFSMNNAKKILKMVDMKLINLMHKYKMIFPKIENNGLENIDKRYAL